MAIAEPFPNLDDAEDVARHWQREHAGRHNAARRAYAYGEWAASCSRQREQAFAFKQAWMWRFGYAEVP